VPWTTLLIDVLRSSSEVLTESGDHAAAESLLDEGIERARELRRITSDHVAASRVLRNLLETAGDRAWAGRRFEASERYYAESLAVRRALLATDRTNLEFQCDLVLGLDRLERALDRANRLDAARERLDEALQISTRLMTDHAGNLRVRTEHAWLNLRRGRSLRRRGDAVAAVQQLQHTRALYRDLRRDQPALRQLRAAEATLHTELGHATADASRVPEAVTAFTHGARLHAKLASGPQGVPVHWLHAANAYGELAHLERERGEPKAELGWARKAAEAVTSAETAGVVDEECANRSRVGLHEARLRAGAAEPTTPADALMVALYRHRQYRCAESSDLFDIAFRGGAVVPDAEDWNFYQATQVAALAAAASKGATSKKHRDRAFAWLGRHLEARRAGMEELKRALAAPDLSAQERTRLGETLTRQRRAWEFARVGDSELAAIRGSKEFDALFQPRESVGSNASPDR
jgi:tetratricopeptide (TPR) repeat protein